MKDKRIIRIRDPKLQKIRLNFRKVISLAHKVEWKKNHQMLNNIRSDSNGSSRSVDEMTSAELTRFRELQRREADLDLIFSASIVVCAQCGRLEGDRYYNKAWQRWYCLDCVKEIHKGHARIMAKKATGRYTCDDDGGFGKSFL